MQKRQTSARGNVSELRVATAYVEAGFAVSVPQQKIRWAKDYEFEQHINDLRREVELRGLEPLTS